MRLVSGTDPNCLRVGSGWSRRRFSRKWRTARSALEMKFLLEEGRARPPVEDMARRSLSLDRYGTRSGQSYPTTSLYTDTPDFDAYRRSPWRGCKFRSQPLRQRGPMFVEQKLRTATECASGDSDPGRLNSKTSAAVKGAELARGRFRDDR